LLTQFSFPAQGSYAAEEEWHSSRPRPSKRQRRLGYDAAAGPDQQDPPHAESDATHFFQQLKQNRRKPRDILEGVTSASQTLLFGGLASFSTFVGIPVASVVFTVKAVTANATKVEIFPNVVIPATLGLIGGGIIGFISTFSIGFISIFHAGNTLWDSLKETPTALKSWIIQGKRWNPYERKWERRQSLEDERRELLLLIEEREAEAAKKRLEMEVLDTKLYDLLEVSSDASKSVIKKAYFSKARHIHPDKNRDDPKAHERFVELHEAYSILSDDKKRSSYNRRGLSSKSSGNTTDFMLMNFDANLFTTILFSNGSDSIMSSPVVEKFVGDLGIANFLDVGYTLISLVVGADELELEEKLTAFCEKWLSSEMNTNQIRRATRSIDIATHLVKKSELLSGSSPSSHTCDTDVCDRKSTPEEGFRQGVRDEAQQILKDSGFYGQTYLEIIGSTLILESSEILVVPRRAQNLYRKWSSRKELVGALHDLYKEIIPFANLEDPSLDDYATACLPDMLRLITLYNRMDISMALREAVWRALNDQGASRSERRKRKRAIRIIGEEFTKLAGGEKGFHNDRDTTVNQLKSNFKLAYSISFKQG